MVLYTNGHLKEKEEYELDFGIKLKLNVSQVSYSDTKHYQTQMDKITDMLRHKKGEFTNLYIFLSI